MDKIFIFSGTTEGRQLSEFLSDKQIHNTVFVATDYGEIVMNESPYTEIRTGRLDLATMEEVFVKENPQYIIDATHPYATIVTQTIKDVCTKLGILTRYVRLQREEIFTDALLREDYPDIDVVMDNSTALDYLKKTNGNILLTTGVKTLDVFASDKLLSDRIYARILPSMDSIKKAYDCGLKPHQIIAMEGPFLSQVNEAFIDQYNIKILVTKNSGIRGGFIEKLEATKNKGIRTLIIDQARKSSGISLTEAEQLLMNELAENVTPSLLKNVAIVGIGAANTKSITVDAMDTIKKANVLIGAKRMIAFGHLVNNAAETLECYKADEIAKFVKQSKTVNIVVLVSGDTGFFSGAGAIRNRLKENNIPVELYPAVSSISYFSSLIGQDYSDAKVVSLHGRDISIDTLFQDKKKTFGIVSGIDDIRNIFIYLKNNFKAFRYFVGYNLGQPDELVREYNSDNPFDMMQTGLYVFGVIFDE